MLPGGKFAKLEAAQMIMTMKSEMGPISKINGVLGRPNAVFTHNPKDFEKVLRNEGIWPERPGSEGLCYHRAVHRAEFFQGVEVLIGTQGGQWDSFRSVVNPVLLQPKNVRLYLQKMSQVNKEFLERSGTADRHREVTEKPDSEKSVLEKHIKIDKKIAMVMAMDLLMAGVDTTTSAFTGLLLCLAKNPEKQAKLREEVLKVLLHKDSEFDEVAISNMPYLRACIKEALRLYPLGIGTARLPVIDVVLSGYRIPRELRSW